MKTILFLNSLNNKTKRMNIKTILMIFFLVISNYLFSQDFDKKAQVKFINETLLLTNEETNHLITFDDYIIIQLYKFVKEHGHIEENKKFVKQIINTSIPESEKYTKENYPGKEIGYPFEWWKDEEWINKNIKLGF